SIAAGAVLDVSARSDSRLTLSTGQTLTGNGTLNGSLTVGPGATISPGTSIGALLITNSVALQGTTFLELDKAANTNDVLRAASIGWSGTVSLTNLTGTLSAGDHFKIFYATCTGAFTNFVPPMADSGLVWDTSTLTNDGTLRISVAPRPWIAAIAVSNGN